MSSNNTNVQPKSASSSKADPFLAMFRCPWRYKLPEWARTMSLKDKAVMGDKVGQLVSEGRVEDAIKHMQSFAGRQRHSLGGGRERKVANSDVCVVEALAVVKVVEDVRRHRLPPAHREHLPYLPLTSTFFSPSELKERLEGVMDAFIDYNAGYVIEELEVLHNLVDLVGNRDWRVVHFQGLSWDLAPLLGERLAPRSHSEALRMLQECTFERMRNRGLTPPPPRMRLGQGQQRLNAYYHKPGPHILQIDEVLIAEEQNIRNFALGELKNGVPVDVLIAKILFRFGVSISGTPGPGMHNAKWIRDVLKEAGEIKKISDVERYVLVQQLRIDHAEERAHERLLQDQRYLFCAFEPLELLLRGWKRTGFDSPDMRKRLVELGNARGCCYDGCLYSRHSMLETGITDGVWTLDPLRSSTNPIACRRHFLIATMLCDPQALDLPPETALALIRSSDGVLNRLIRGGVCGTPNCVTQFVYGMAVETDPSGQDLCMCASCARWWKARMTTMLERGQAALARGELYPICGSRFAQTIDCPMCENACTTNERFSGDPRCYGVYGFVNTNAEPCCIVCFNGFGGIDSPATLRARSDYPSPASKALLNEAMDRMVALFRSSTDDELRAAFGVEAIQLAATLYAVPLSVDCARKILSAHILRNKRRAICHLVMQDLERMDPSAVPE